MSLLESEGWKVVGPIRCLCPKCDGELSSNAFARSCHKKSCAGWKQTESALPQTTTLFLSPVIATLPRAGKNPGPVLETTRPAPVRLERVVDRPSWTRFQVSGVNEYVRHLPCDDSATFLRLRVRRVGMNDSPRYTSYRGAKYLGEHDSVERAMDAAEKEGT